MTEIRMEGILKERLWMRFVRGFDCILHRKQEIHVIIRCTLSSFKFDIFLRMDWQSSDEKETEEFVPPPYPTLELSFREEKSYNSRTLFVANYGAASLFAHSLVGGVTPCNRLNFSRQKQQSLADLYQVEDSLYLIFNDFPDPMKEIYLAKFIQKHITAESIVVLVAVSRTTLKEPTGCPLAHVKTSSFPEQSSVARFTEGLSGVAAEFLQWGELNRKPVCCFVGIFGEYELSSQIIEAGFGGLRGRLGMNGNADIGEKVKKYNMKKYANKLYL